MQNMPKFRDLRLVACADMRPEAAQAQAAQFGIEAMSIDALLARPDIEIIVNLTTPERAFRGEPRGADAPASTCSAKSRSAVEADDGRDAGRGGRRVAA